MLRVRARQAEEEAEEKLWKEMEEKLKFEVEKIRKEEEEEKALKVRKPLHHQGTKKAASAHLPRL